MTETRTTEATTTARITNVDMKLEVVILPVSDVDRATDFYKKLGWRHDYTPPGSGVVQFTPTGADTSIHFGTGLITAAPGSASAFLIVSDIGAAHQQLVDAGIDVSDIFHYTANGPVSGPDPDRSSYNSYATFNDPDGNSWKLQEVTSRLPGRVDSATTVFTSHRDLVNALFRAAIAHGEHEKRAGGEYDENWPDWYAAYMVAEQAGTELPT
ncbi:VOC family protein [Rhodococcus opacus]|jgi:catechol 2,3-dioxygenase-like lactoylglutathione lyase family enzyme|uniref:VOC family protein n=1 Tax=Rhodococcus opacus TaxID=37919 RepID=UPI000EA878A7|nr:VOC family protein [Rhodococcus opacus]QZS52690.1 VOC family protein [Rhodococcus opacus]RKM65311.1 glyoxalase [Rhodococcus opacus]